MNYSFLCWSLFGMQINKLRAVISLRRGPNQVKLTSPRNKSSFLTQLGCSQSHAVSAFWFILFTFFFINSYLLAIHCSTMKEQLTQKQKIMHLLSTQPCLIRFTDETKFQHSEADGIFFLSNKKQNLKMLSSSSCCVIQVCRSPEIPNWFEKTLITQCSKLSISQKLHCGDFSLKQGANNVFSNQFRISGVSRDINYAGQAVWSHFMVSFFIFFVTFLQ